ncbi:MAG: DICT sensory domain-containing protein [Cyanophyceae cyanobacterium]
MSRSESILQALLRDRPHLRSQTYFKASLTALSHAMEDLVLAGTGDRPLVIASFQRERFYRQEARRYLRIAERTDRVFVLAAPETDFKSDSGPYETIAFDPEDALAQEWHLIVLGDRYSACLICAERLDRDRDVRPTPLVGDDRVRRFEGVWTFDRQVTCTAAQLLLERIRLYRPELDAKLDRNLANLPCALESSFNDADPEPFAQRLVTYLQAGQYKLMKAYRNIAVQQRKERLINAIIGGIRQSLDPDRVLAAAAQDIGQALRACRCLVYRCKAGDAATAIDCEYLGSSVPSVAGHDWPLMTNPLFLEAITRQGPAICIDTADDRRFADPDQCPDLLRQQIQTHQLSSWLIAPVYYRDKLLAAIELHHCGPLPRQWSADEVNLVEAIALQLGGALLQAQAYTDLEHLNEQLEALDRTRSNLIAITGHELRTPLSTIRVCLESLALEPDMPPELRDVMIDTALTDAERMRSLVQDFLTLSRFESGRVEWNLEPLPLEECIELALSSIRSHANADRLPRIELALPTALPPVRADGEWLVEVLSKLLDNACKFTEATGTVTVAAIAGESGLLQVTVADTGRGIEPTRLEAVFDRFYQEEGSLRRTVGGTGLGLAICRQIIRGLGGTIWAESDGKDCGSRFHFTVPVFEGSPEATATAPRIGVTSEGTRPRSPKSPKAKTTKLSAAILDDP